MVDRSKMSVEDLSRSQLKSEEKFTDQRSSHCTANHCRNKSAPSFDMPFGTVINEIFN